MDKLELNEMQHSLGSCLMNARLSDDRIADVLDSGYYLRSWMPLPGTPPPVTVSDMLYGNKVFSSRFETTSFIAYLRGEHTFQRAPCLRRLKVRHITDIRAILNEEPCARYVADGSLSFRGQPREHTIRRRVPNPFRRNDEGLEISIMPGAYRQSNTPYTCATRPTEVRTFEVFAHEFEPSGNPSDLHFAYDLMRTEQHYATQTSGLDVSFDLRSALFFATYQFAWGDDGLAYYRKVPRGEHQGVIYLFRFGAPSVRQTEYLIQEFDFFRTHRPERILRQSCGLFLSSPPLSATSL
jgi:hypothetical protein